MSLKRRGGLSYMKTTTFFVLILFSLLNLFRGIRAENGNVVEGKKARHVEHSCVLWPLRNARQGDVAELAALFLVFIVIIEIISRRIFCFGGKWKKENRKNYGSSFPSRLFREGWFVMWCIYIKIASQLKENKKWECVQRCKAMEILEIQGSEKTLRHQLREENWNE